MLKRVAAGVRTSATAVAHPGLCSSSIALFGGAAWGFALIFDIPGCTSNVTVNILFAFTMPLLPLFITFWNAMNVWSMRKSLHKRNTLEGSPQIKPVIDHKSLAIICNCPLLIQVPADYDLPMEDDHVVMGRGYDLVVGDLQDFDYPLELTFRQSVAGSPARAPALVTGAAALGGLASHWMQRDQPADHRLQKRYLRFRGRTGYNKADLEERQVLLDLRLIPDYGQLRFLRSRSMFQSLITGLQGGGYVFGVLQRMTQHLAISPLEAMTCFLSTMVILQLLVELYASSHYQRVLVLCPSYHQFSEFWKARRSYPDITVGYVNRYTITAKIFIAIVGTVFLGFTIYYAVHYLHTCTICSVAAVLFFLALLFSLAMIFVIVLVLVDGNCNFNLVIPLALLCFVCYVGSLVVAVVSTVTHWSLFHSPTNNSLSWILPHMSDS